MCTAAKYALEGSLIVCSVPQNRFFMYRSSLKARTLNVLAFKDEHVLLLTSHKLKWYFDHDQFTAAIIFFILGLGEVCRSSLKARTCGYMYCY